jgi:hypothetical protein
MLKRHRRLILFASAVLALGVGTMVFRSREPSYAGRSLSSWLAEIALNSEENHPYDKAAEAVGRIGTNALPTLLRWYSSTEPPEWKQTLSSLLGNLPAFISANRFVTRFLQGDDRRPQWGRIGLLLVGSNAIPELAKLATNEVFEARAVGTCELLGQLGPAAVPHLVGIVTNTRNSFIMSVAVRSLGEIGEGARSAIPTLIQCLAEPSAPVAETAAEALGLIRQDPDTVVPALAGCLPGSRPNLQCSVATALSRFGPAAHQAVPALLLMATNRNPALHFRAEYALRQIAPEALTNAPPR